MVLQVGEEEVEMKVVEVDVLGLRIDVAILVLLIWVLGAVDVLFQIEQALLFDREIKVVDGLFIVVQVKVFDAQVVIELHSIEVL